LWKASSAEREKSGGEDELLFQLNQSINQSLDVVIDCVCPLRTTGEFANFVGSLEDCYLYVTLLFFQLEFRDKACVFHERVQQKHMVLQSSYNKTWFVGFGRDGKSLLGSDWQKKLPKNRGCYNFLKTGEKFFASLNDVSQDETPEHHRKVHRLSQKHFKVPATVHLESLPSLTVNAKKTLPSSPLHSSV
jgi:hypothetical protein